MSVPLALSKSEARDKELRLLQEMEEALQESRVGAERIRDIVARLRTFARNDEAPQEPMDITQAIEAALNMVQEEFLDRDPRRDRPAHLRSLLHYQATGTGHWTWPVHLSEDHQRVYGAHHRREYGRRRHHLSSLPPRCP